MQGNAYSRVFARNLYIKALLYFATKSPVSCVSSQKHVLTLILQWTGFLSRIDCNKMYLYPVAANTNPMFLPILVVHGGFYSAPNACPVLSVTSTLRTYTDTSLCVSV